MDLLLFWESENSYIKDGDSYEIKIFNFLLNYNSHATSLQCLNLICKIYSSFLILNVALRIFLIIPLAVPQQNWKEAQQKFFAMKFMKKNKTQWLKNSGIIWHHC